MGPPHQSLKKLEMIERVLLKIVKKGLDRLWVFFTIFHRRTAPLAERSRPMWQYSGKMDPDRSSSTELSGDEIWGHLGRVL